MSNWEEKTKLEDQNLSFFVKGMKVMWGLLGEERRTLFFTIIWIGIVELMGLTFSVLLKFLFDELPVVAGTGHLSSLLISLLVALIVIKLAALLLKRFALEIKFLKTLIKLENLWPAIAQKKLLELSLGFHERENTGKKIDKINKGCERMIDIIGRMRWNFVPQVFYILMNTAILLFIDWRLGLLFILPFPIAAYLYLQAFRKAAPAFESWEEKKEKSAGLFCQSIINIQTVQNYAQELREAQSFTRLRKEMEKLDTDASVKMQLYFFTAIFILWLLFIGTIAIAIYFVVNGTNTTGTIVYLITTGTSSLDSLWQLVNEYNQIMKRLISVVRLKDLLEEKIDILDAPEAVCPKEYSGHIQFDRVDFAYPNKEMTVLSEIDLKIAPGEMVAFVGKSGGGKSTAIKLICRMFDVKKGAIRLDGIDIRNIRLDWYRRLFATVQQDVDIFDSSVCANIRYAYPDASKEQVKEAVKAAHLEKTFYDSDRFPKGLDEQVGEKGVRLSGGERQRVGIARAYIALLNGAKVLILDEATSNLDSQAERAIQKMIKMLRTRQSVTIIAIAHRLSTIREAQNIYIIDHGRIVEKGNHEGLVRKNGIYAELVALQRMGEVRT